MAVSETHKIVGLGNDGAMTMHLVIAGHCQHAVF